MKEFLTVIDIETTGLDRVKDHIIQLSMIRYKYVPDESFEQIDTYDTYICPDGDFSISIGAYFKHGITAKMLLDKPKLKDIAKDVIEFLDPEKTDILTYNGNFFDLPFLTIQFAKLGYELDFTKFDCYDAFVIEQRINSNTLEGTFKRHCGKTMEEFGLNAHNSLSDVEATMMVFAHQMADADKELKPEPYYGSSNFIKYALFQGTWQPVIIKGKYRDVGLSLVAKIDMNYINWLVGPKSDIDKSTKNFIIEFIKKLKDD